MVFSSDSRRVVRSWPGQGTCEPIYEDNQGCTWRLISEAEAQQIANSTVGRVARLYPNGSIR